MFLPSANRAACSSMPPSIHSRSRGKAARAKNSRKCHPSCSAPTTSPNSPPAATTTALTRRAFTRVLRKEQGPHPVLLRCAEKGPGRGLPCGGGGPRRGVPGGSGSARSASHRDHAHAIAAFAFAARAEALDVGGRRQVLAHG